MLVQGQVRMVRRRQRRRLLHHPDPARRRTATQRVAYRAEYVHLAVGYPGLRFLPELQGFRTENSDFYHVVSAYEDHEHIYELARSKHVIVMLRGGGIVASRVLQRLMDDREKYGLPTEIVHLFRTYVGRVTRPECRGAGARAATASPTRGSTTRNRCGAGSSSRGCARWKARTARPAYKQMGGTNTPWRRRWQQQMREGRANGWYRTLSGHGAADAAGSGHDGQPDQDERKGCSRSRRTS